MPLDQQFLASGQFNRAWEIPKADIVRLRAFLAHVVTRGNSGLSPQKLHEMMLQYARDGYVPSHDLINRFIRSTNGTSTRRPDTPIMLVFLFGRLRMERDERVAHFDSREFEEFALYCEQYFEKMSTDRKFRDRYILHLAGNRAAISSGAASELIALINTLALPQNSVFGVKQVVFGSKTAPPDGHVSHFVTYRYGKDPDFVFKSHTTLSSSKLESAPVIYANVTKNRFGKRRASSGFALNLASKLYLIGNLEEGAALEVVALSNFSVGRQIVSGLILTPSAAGENLAARITMVPTVTPPDEADLGRKSYADIKSELGNLDETITNTVAFSLVKPIFLDNEAVSQSLMVEQVSKLLRNEHGKPRLTYEDGREFNPASSREYTYNSALREFS